MIKKGLVFAWLMLLCGGVFALFWYNDWIYQLPTPVPENYKSVPIGKEISFSGAFEYGEKPVFLHFFNPDCPCSKFNIKHFQSLVREYGKSVDFKVVVMSAKEYSAKDIRDRFDLDIPVLFDSKLAAACGVYSTPQAVMLNTKHQLHYRGNYNRSRYCTDEKTSYAKIALAGLIKDEKGMSFDPIALKSYGCTLPYCKN